MTAELPVQLRLGFSTPSRPQRLELRLSGLSVSADPADRDVELACSYLAGSGVSVRLDAGRGAMFPVRELAMLSFLPEQVDLVPIGEVRPLLELVRNRPDDGLPVTVTTHGRGHLTLSWMSHGRDFHELLELTSAAALMSLEVPLVSSEETWDALVSAARLPVVLARARVNMDGFVELSTSVPFKLEMAPLPALFRVDDTHFGLPVAYANHVDRVPGLIWDGPRPTFDAPPSRPPALPFPLGGPAMEGLHELVSALARSRGQALIWPDDLSRRILCTAAVESLEAFPLLVVTRPSGLWAWQRHLDVIGRPGSLIDADQEVHLVTYRDLAARRHVQSPAAVIFDDLDTVAEFSPELLPALHRLDGVADSYRIACCSHAPRGSAPLIEMLSLLRPVEFRSGVPAVLRYPGDSAERLEQHARCYLTAQRVAEYEPAFRSSTVEVLELGEQLRDAMEATRREVSDPRALLPALLEMTSSGASSVMSPKIAHGVAFVQQACGQGRRVAVLTRSSTAATLLWTLLRPLPVGRCGPGQSPADDAVIVEYGDQLPDVRTYEWVLALDYPFSTGALESAVGSAADPDGPSRVVLLHLAGSVDDRLAALAALRREEGFTDAVTPSDLPDEDVEYLLST